jgi:hypothetical protein
LYRFTYIHTNVNITLWPQLIQIRIFNWFFIFKTKVFKTCKLPSFQMKLIYRLIKIIFSLLFILSACFVLVWCNILNIVTFKVNIYLNNINYILIEINKNLTSILMHVIIIKTKSVYNLFFFFLLPLFYARQKCPSKKLYALKSNYKGMAM